MSNLFAFLLEKTVRLPLKAMLYTRCDHCKCLHFRFGMRFNGGFSHLCDECIVRASANGITLEE